jgi:hypothetical protein
MSRNLINSGVGGPQERPSQAPPINLMDPAIQAEIARQVALAAPGT